jgi:serine protease Do
MEENKNQIPQVELPKYQPYYEVPQSYTYQNPNPYESELPPMPPVSKKKPAKGLVIAAVIVAVVMVICSVGILTFPYLNLDWITPAQSFAETEETVQNKTQATGRAEGEVYNVPEMNTAPKDGNELSLVEVNKKVKDSVVAILIGKGETEFSGSGFVISEDGYILTNSHVIEGAAAIEVVLSDGTSKYSAKVVGSDSATDIAVLKVEATGLKPVELGDSNALEVGETVAAIGNPYGIELAGTFTNGIVSALNRKLEMNGTYMNLIQTNASINPGNSGGPLVNAYGQVVGITSSKLVATGYEGIGFAIPINHVVEITEELVTYGYIKTRAYIGVRGTDVTANDSSMRNLPQGVLVVEIEPDCDASKKGLKPNDIIVAFNGEKIQSMAELNEKKDAFHPGDTATMTYWRNGKETTITIRLGEAF